MEIIFKGAFFKGGEVYALSATMKRPEGLDSTKTLPLPTSLSPREAAKSLRELAKWIEQESKNVR